MPLPPTPARAALWEDTRTDRALGGGGEGGRRRAQVPALLPMPLPWLEPLWGGLALHPAGSLLACSVGLASPAWLFLWTGRRSSRAQASAPQSRPQKPWGRTEALREEGAHWPDRQKSRGPRGLGGHCSLHVLPEGGRAQDPAQFPPFCRPRRPPKMDGGSTPAFLRCSSRDIGPPFRSARFTGLQFAQCHATVTSTQFQNLPPAPQRVPVCITVVVASSGPPTLPAWGPRSASRDLPVQGVHTRAATGMAFGTHLQPRRVFKVRSPLFLRASGLASSLALGRAPRVDGPRFVYRFICQPQRALPASWLLEHL